MTTNRTLNRFAIVLVTACIVGASSAWAQEGQATSPPDLFDQAIKAYEQKDYALFLQLSEQLHGMDSANATHTYNMACGYALTGKKSEAYKWLQKSIELGFRNAKHIQDDADFASIKDEDRFKQLLEYAKTGEAPPVTADSVEMEVFTPGDLDPEKKYPLIVALHGYGKSPTRALDNWKEAAEKVGAILIAPQGTVQMSASAFHWGDPVQAVPVVAAVVEKACQDMPVDPNQVVLTGFSQGGSLAYEAARKHPELFCGLIPVAGRYAAAKEGSAEGEAGGEAKPRLNKVFIMVGGKDRPSVSETTKQAVEDFQARGCEVQSHIYEGVGHTYPENRLEEQLKALKFILGR